MADDGEPAQGRGMKELEDDPVADDMLDVVRHHREHVGHEIMAEYPVAQGRKGNPPVNAFRAISLVMNQKKILGLGKDIRCRTAAVYPEKSVAE